MTGSGPWRLGPTEERVRLADLLGAFSLASDLAVGLGGEHGARSCYIGMHVARELGLAPEQQVHLFYSELLKDAGCTAYTSQLATMWLADEISAKRELQFFRDAQNPFDVLPWMFRHVAAGAPFTTKVARVADFLRNGKEFMREGFESTCQMANRIAQRLGMPTAVQDALVHVFEQWDGKGMPHGVRGQEIPLVSRIVFVTSFLEIYHSSAGREASLRLARDRRGKSFDPSVVDAFLSTAQSEEFWTGLEDERLWDAVLAMEPEESPHRYITQENLTAIALAFADYADMKSPYRAGHSRDTAEISQRIARRMALPESEVTIIHRAALMHDIGVVAVPSFVLNKPRAQLTAAEWEQFRLHPYHSERILSKVPAVTSAVPIVGAHHEQPDGRGYHRGLPGAQIPPAARIIAVADRFAELTHNAPDHPAFEPEDAIDQMRTEAGSRLAVEAFEALAEDVVGVGQAKKSRLNREEWPAGLTAREVEVLRLVSTGMTRREAATALFVTEGTIRSHLEHIYSKIGVSNRSAATLFAMEHGLVP